MATSRWFGLDAALENLLNEEYFDESDIESDEDGIQGEDDDRQEQQYDNEANVLARINGNNNNNAAQQHPLVINGDDGVASVQATFTCTNAATEGSSATSNLESTDNIGT